MVRPKLWNGKFLSIIIGIVMVFGGLSACAQSGSSNTNTPQVSGPVKIGISMSLTGDSSADGQAMKQGYELWADQVNKSGGLLGHQVQLIILDDGTKVEQTRTNYQTLINVDKVNFVLGPFDDRRGLAGRYG